MRSVLVLIPLLALAACNSRFNADFEMDTVGQLPAADPPGPPDDEIIIYDHAVDGAGIVIRVTDEPALANASGEYRFMSLQRESDPGLSSTVALRSAEMATGTQSIYLQWEQVLDGGGSGHVQVFVNPDGGGGDVDFCEIITGNDTISLACGVGFEVIDGIDTQSPLTVLMRIDRSPHRAVLQVIQDGTATELVTIADNDVPSPAEGERLDVLIDYDGQSDGAYRFNSVAVEERDPN